MSLAFLSLHIGANSLLDILLALVAFFASVGLTLTLRSILLSRLSVSGDDRTITDDVVTIIGSILSPIYLIVFLLVVPLSMLTLSAMTVRVVWTGVFLVFVFEASRLLTWLAEYAVLRMSPRERERGAKRSRFSVLFFMIRVGFFAVGTVFALSNIGIEVGPLLASLGVVGIVIGFGMQNILSDLFATLIIQLDRPFEERDTIALGTDTGTVQKIGVRSTHLRLASGDTLVIPNRDIAASRIRNLSAGKTRVLLATCTVPVGIGSDRANCLGTTLTAELSDQESFELRYVRLRGIRESLYEYEVSYAVRGSDPRSLIEAREHLVLGIVRVCEREEVGLTAVTVL